MRICFQFQMIKAVACAVALLAGPASAVTVGQPFLVVDEAEGGAPTGSILDFFDSFGPTGVKQVSLNGTITSTVGAPSVVGKTLDFETNQSPGASGASLTLGTTIIDEFDIFSSGSGFFDYDPFQGGPGNLNFAFHIFPPYTEEFGTFVYGGDFSESDSEWVE